MPIPLASRLFRSCVFALFLTATCLASAKTAYQPQGECGDLPRITVQTPPGFCIGIVADGFKFPRGVLPLPNGNLVVVDMGGWVEHAGSLWLLRKRGSGYDKQRLLAGLDRPNGIALGPDGLVYVGVVKRIFRFDLKDPARTMTDVIGGNAATPPLPGIGRHLLTAMVFDRRGDLYVNVGSGSDHCENEDGAPIQANKPCPETTGNAPLGVIRKYEMAWPKGTVKRWENYALGLRNSMALAVHPDTGELWQGENSRDAIHMAMPALKNDEELPHDELNRVQRGMHYGWPYCFDDQRPSPEYPAWNCSGYQKPARLLPAHAAPLGMTFYTARQFPAQFRNSLIIGFHGYRKYGHRIVALLPDQSGAPLGKMVDLVSGWERKPHQPMGAPVDVKAGADGAVYISEDRNGTVLRLQYSGKP